MKTMKDFHILEGITIKNELRVRREYPFSEVAPTWQRAIKSAPNGESISETNRMGYKLYVRKFGESLQVCVISPAMTYIDHVFQITDYE